MPEKDLQGDFSPEAKECPFCKISNGVSPSILLGMNDGAMAIMSLEDHPLVIPKDHITSETARIEEGQKTMSDVFSLATRLGPVTQEAFGATGFNLLMNSGRSAGQELDHMHVHIIPRIEGDGKLRFRKLPEAIKTAKELDTIVAFIRARS